MARRKKEVVERNVAAEVKRVTTCDQRPATSTPKDWTIKGSERKGEGEDSSGGDGDRREREGWKPESGNGGGSHHVLNGPRGRPWPMQNAHAKPAAAARRCGCRECSMGKS
jgi:hypothetical protein